MTTAYPSKKLEGGGDVEILIINGKVFEPVWPDPVEPTPKAMKAMIQAEYGTRAKRVEKLRINLSMSYDLVLGQCTNYLRSRIEGQEKTDRTSNEQDLLELLKRIKSLSYKYDEDTEYHHAAYHIILCCFKLFRQGEYRNLEYKQRFKEQNEMLEAYNRGVLFGNSPGSTA